MDNAGQGEPREAVGEVARHFNGLTPAEAERLVLLAEECAEVIQVVGKILRHGLDSHHPADLSVQPQTNQQLLNKEVGDLCASMLLLFRSHMLDQGAVRDAKEDKLRRLPRWLHHAEVPMGLADAVKNGLA